MQQLEDDESDEEDNRDSLQGADKEAIANELFEGDEEVVIWLSLKDIYLMHEIFESVCFTVGWRSRPTG